MSWDPVWEEVFHKRSSWGQYPCEELIRFVARNFYSIPEKHNIRFLELGCGPGGGPGWYIAREGFDYHGLDASPTAIYKSQLRFASEELKGNFVQGIFNNLPWKENTFDCVIDIASLQCNATVDAEIILNEVLRVLKPQGQFFSLSAMAGSAGDGEGERIDSFTLREVISGPFKGMGIMRFATRQSLEWLHRKFVNLNIGYTIRSLEDGGEIRNWIITCAK